MSRIDELIRQLCPNGVRFQRISEVAPIVTSQASPEQMGTERVDLYSLPAFDAGRVPEDAPPTEIKSSKIRLQAPAVLFPKLNPRIPRVWAVPAPGDRAYTSTEFYPLTPREDTLSIKFLYHLMRSHVGTIAGMVRGSTNSHQRIQRAWLLTYMIPVPPRVVQDEIVTILDTFSGLTAELEAELEARRTQYEYYRYDLFRQLDPDGVPFRELKEVAKIRNGKNHKSFPSGPIPVYGTGGVMTSIDRAAHEGPSVLIPRKGSLNQLYFVEEPFWTVDTIFYTEIDETQVRPKFFYYYLKTQRLEELNQAGGIPSLTQKVLNRLRVPVPPFEVQNEVVRILDGFTELTAELEAEIRARRKQYEYYRDRLLRFEEVPG